MALSKEWYDAEFVNSESESLPVSYTHLDVYKRQPYIIIPWSIG